MNSSELVKELRASVKRRIRHPVFECGYKSDKYAYILNRQFEYRKNQMTSLTLAGKFRRWVFMHAVEERPLALASIRDSISEIEYVALVAEVWNDPAAVFHSCDVLRNALFVEMLRDNQSLRDAAMTAPELDSYHDLDGKVTAYRAHDSYNEVAPSWTISREVAERIRHVMDYDRVSTRLFNKSQVLAYFERRGEYEVIVTNCQ